MIHNSWRHNLPEEWATDVAEGRELPQFAWPGGYPLYFVTADGEALSFEAAIAERRQVIRAIGHDEKRSGWRIVAVETNWEDTNLRCSHTNKLIECAYDGDPDPDIVRENRADLADLPDSACGPDY